MRSYRAQLPRFLLGKHQLIMTVNFAAFWSLVFLLLCVPLSHNAWFELGKGEAFLFTVVFYLIALAIVVFSKVLLYIQRNSDNFTVGRYIMWNAAEILIIALPYSFFTVEVYCLESSPLPTSPSDGFCWAPRFTPAFPSESLMSS